MNPRLVFLVGTMGSGKSTVGRVLAARLGRRFVDMDERIASRDGRSIPRIFQEDGEEGFRRLEKDTLLRICRSKEDLVVATGGGVVLDADNRRLLRRGVVVWIDVPPAVAASRIAGDPNRPLLAGEDPLRVAEKLDRIRRPIYAGTADHRVDGGSSVDEIVDDITAFMERNHE